MIVLIVAPGAESAVSDAAHRRLIESTPKNLIALCNNHASADADIDVLSLPRRIITILRNNGITRCSQLAALSANDVSRLSGIGEKYLKTLRPHLRAE